MFPNTYFQHFSTLYHSIAFKSFKTQGTKRHFSRLQIPLRVKRLQPRSGRILGLCRFTQPASTYNIESHRDRSPSLNWDIGCVSQHTHMLSLSEHCWCIIQEDLLQTINQFFFINQLFRVASWSHNIGANEVVDNCIPPDRLRQNRQLLKKGSQQGVIMRNALGIREVKKDEEGKTGKTGAPAR